MRFVGFEVCGLLGSSLQPTQGKCNLAHQSPCSKCQRAEKSLGHPQPAQGWAPQESGGWKPPVGRAPSSRAHGLPGKGDGQRGRSAAIHDH